MKKVLGALLMLSMAIGGTVVAPNTTKDVQAATTIQSNRWYEGMTDGENDQVYTYKMQGSGYFYYQVIPIGGGCYYKGNFEENSVYWVETSIVKNYKMYDGTTKAKNTEGGFESHRFSFKSGSRITIKVKDSENYKTRYKIKVTFVKMKNFEKENNNSKKAANKIKKGTYTGLAMGDDNDFFVFKAPKTKKYKIRYVCTSEEYCYQETEIYKGNKLYSNRYHIQGGGWSTLFSGKLKKGQKIYINVIDMINGDSFYKINVK